MGDELGKKSKTKSKTKNEETHQNTSSFISEDATHNGVYASQVTKGALESGGSDVFSLRCPMRPQRELFKETL